MTTAPARRPLSSLLEVPEVAEIHAPRAFNRLPVWLTAGGILVLLLAISAVLRTRTLSGELWFEEAGAVGLAQQPLGSLLHAARLAGAAPLYYLILHLWIDAFGSSESATHSLSLVIALVTIPVAMWVGWALDGRRAGFFAAILFAFSSYLTRYGQETAPFALMVALGLLGTAALILAFVQRRRRWLWLFGASLALMAYTQGSAAWFWFGAAVAIWVVARCSPANQRRPIARDAALCYGIAALLYLPWLPSTIGEIAHSTAVWHYTPLLGATIPSQLLGSERVDVTLLTAVVLVVAPLLARARRGSEPARMLWVTLAIPAAAFVLARIVGAFLPVWASRYFAAVVPALLLLGALACARARVVGLAAIVCCVAFLANPASFAPSHKSDMADVAAELAPLMHRGDWVVVGQPEQAPLAAYYMPARLRWETTLGPDPHPSWMDWDGALARLSSTSAQATLTPLIASLRPGQQLLYVRPLTEGERNWDEPWTQLVRRRAAQWSAILAGDVAHGTLVQVALAPHNYPSSCCIASSAVLYRKA
ncbi:MAG: glycosyltransferase family 39 protein [Solirubrobacteraceae bacterium]